MAERYAGYYQPRNRSGRSGRRRKEEPQADAVVVSLTAQILVCILLAAALGIVSRVNADGFRQFRNTYDSMSSGEAAGGDFYQLVAQWSQRDGLVGSVGATLSRWFGEETDSQNLESRNHDSEEPTEAEEAVPEVVADAFEFSYLTEQPANGGLNPVMISAGMTKQFAASRDTTLFPVTLPNIIQPPVSGKITSRYAYRIHPISEKTDFHNGIDIAAEEGRAIVAALPGEVVEVGESDIYGNYIILQHSGSLQTFYAHCSELIAQEGMIVRQGERIAKVGQTGMATGPHLHFSVIVNNMYTDPFYVLSDHITVIGEREGDA